MNIDPSQPITRKELLLAAARSRIAFALYATGALGLSVLAAVFLWQARDVLAFALCAIVVLYGCHWAASLLPWSPKYRARLERARQWEERFPSYRFRLLFWVGLFGICWPLAKILIWHEEFFWMKFIVPGVCLVAGAAAYSVWLLKHRRKVSLEEPDLLP